MATWSLFSIQLAERWRAIDPAWRWALGVYAVARLVYTLWAFVVLLIVPSTLQNLDLFGEPVVAFFDMQTGERYLFSRRSGEREFIFQNNGDGTITDRATGSVWSLSDGTAVRGELSGTKLATAALTVEEVFPYHSVTAQGGWVGLWQRFDTNWYLKIVEQGYAIEDGSTVFFPLYPAMIWAGGLIVGGNHLTAALLISNAALVVALYLLFRLAAELYDADSAKRAVIYQIAFPTAFFMFAGYTESLFLALVLGAFFFGRREQWVWASVCGALAALTRLQGVLLLVPLLYMVMAQKRAGKLDNGHAARAAIALGLIPIVTLGFLGFNRLALLSSYEGELHAKFVLPWDNFVAAIVRLQDGASLIDLSNLIVTVLFAALVGLVWLKLPRAYALYALVMFCVPLFRMTTTQPLVSMLRYVLVLFPVFMLLGAWGRNRWVERAVMYPSLLLSFYFSAQFWLWGWVA